MTNNDNFEEFEHAHNETHEEPTQTPKGIRANLGGAWRSQPLFKLFVLMVVVGAVVAIAVSLFSGSNGRSQVGLLKPPDIHEPPGGKQTPNLQEQTEMANKQRTEEAIKSGNSSIPTPLGPGTDTGELSPAPPKDDPLNELRAEVENMNKQLQEAKQQAAAPPPPPAAQEPFDTSLAQAMQRQMGQLLDSWVPKGTKQVAVYDLDELNRERKEQAGGTGASNGADKNGAAASQTPPAKTIVPSGTVSYAELLTEANSDVPGPILAQVVSGPLKGARVIGRFQVNDGYADYLVMTFKLADLNGTDYKINALALDPDTTLGGMATEVDQRYMMRLVLPAAAGFLQGFASALGQGNQNIVTNGTTTIVEQSSKGTRQGLYSGLGTAAQTASQFFQTQANQTKPLVRVAAGTPMGLFFVDTVTDAPVTPGSTDQTPCTFPGQTGCMNVSMPYGAQGGYGAGYGGYGAGQGNYGSAYPVLYPGMATQGANLNYGGFGVSGIPNAYPGSTVYYTH